MKINVRKILWNLILKLILTNGEGKGTVSYEATVSYEGLKISISRALEQKNSKKFICVCFFFLAIISVTRKELSSPKTVYFYLFSTHINLISTTLYKLVVTQMDQTSQQAHKNNSSHTWLHISVIWQDFKNLNIQLMPQTNYIRISASGTQALVFCKASQVSLISSQNQKAQGSRGTFVSVRTVSVMGF